MTITEIISNTINVNNADNIGSKNIFDPNNYTESKNPILSSLFHMLVNDTLGNNSEDVQAMHNGKTENEKFTETLTAKQLELYDEAYWESCLINSTIEAERFILGFKFASMLFKEGFII